MGNDYGNIVAKADPDYLKDAGSIEPFTLNWVSELKADTISTSAWTLPDGLVNVSDSNTNSEATIKVSGGTDGYTYRLVNSIVTAGGYTYEKTIVVKVDER